MKLNQKGFTAFELVLVVIVLFTIGVAGYYAYQSRQDHTNYSVNIPHKPKVVTPPTSPSPTVMAGTEFIIPELGIKLTLPDEIKDLRYVTRTANGQTGAQFSTASLEAADSRTGGKYCTATADAPLGLIDLVTPTPGGERAIKMIGSKSLNYAHAQSACSTDSTVMSLAQKQADEFLQALNTAVAAQ